MNVLQIHIRLILLVCLQILNGCGGGGSSDRATASLPSSNATLSSLTVSEGTLMPTFSSTTLSYTVEVGTADSITVASVAADSNSVVDVNGSGDAEAVVAIVEGDNIIDIVLVAEDGRTTQTYTVTVTRNSAPIVAFTSIFTGVWPGVVVGDTLTGNYGYRDVDGDPEGATMFRWLRDGVAIPGAVTREYTVTESDVPAMITFEVTPVAASGDTMGISKSSEPIATSHMMIEGFARYLDANTNSVSDAGDQLIVPFNSAVTDSLVTADDFLLPVSGDDFGTGSEVSAGPAQNELTITLGVSPKIRTRGEFSTSALFAGSASGIEVLNGTVLGETGARFQDDSPADVIAGYVVVPSEAGPFSRDASVALADIDADADLDLISITSANDTVANQVYTNSAGNFTLAYTLGVHRSHALAVSDVDGDGDTDLVIAIGTGLNESGNRVYLNDGSGLLSDSGQTLGANDSRAVVLGDVDGDGDQDVAVANVGAENESAGNRIYLNNGAGVFTDSGQVLGNADSLGLALGDIDADGDLDLAVANGSFPAREAPTGSLQIYENDGAGLFSEIAEFDSGAITSVALGDIDSDSDLDLIASNRIYLNGGDGQFDDTGATIGNWVSARMSLVDADDDGDLDVAFAPLVGCDCQPPSNDTVFHNNGSGNFIDTGQRLASDVTFATNHTLAFGDVDQDGDLDIVSGNGFIYLSSLTGS